MFLDVMKDKPNERIIYFSDGGSAKLLREDPYGMWVIKWSEGKTPDALKDQKFTEAGYARQAVQHFVDSNAYNGYAKVVSEKVEMAPPIEVKKRYRTEGAPNRKEEATV